MSTQNTGLEQLQEQFALYQHIQVYHWLADTWQWQEMSKLFSDDTEYEFEVAQSKDSQAGSFKPWPGRFDGPVPFSLSPTTSCL
jgi:hypothetical protein